jgi:putative zinc finger/helix-turn-helix YgiT family protein
VALTGIRVFWCPGCRAEYPEIPNVIGLHRTIASALARKPSPLTGAEFRFLRKEIGLKAKELAKHLGTTDVNLSRWETGETPINPAADRLVRVLYTLNAVKAHRAVEPANFVEGFLETFARIAPRRHPKALSLEIPAERLAPPVPTTLAIR